MKKSKVSLSSLVLVIIFIGVIGVSIKPGTSITKSKEDVEMITWRPNMIPPDTSFTMNEVYTALQHTYEEYGYPYRVRISFSLHEDAKEAIDMKGGKKYYTRTYLSKNDGDTLYVSSRTFYEKPNSFPPLLENLITKEVVNKYDKLVKNN